MRDHSIVLLSSGLDSTVNLCKAVRETTVVRALTFDYGQRAASREVEQGKKICDQFQVEHQVISLPWLKELTQTALVNRESSLPELNDKELDCLDSATQSAKAVWVPNRNGVFINIAASVAESLKAHSIVVGFNAEEAKTFPDNSEYFIKSINQSLAYSTLKKPAVICYTSHMQKKEIVDLGRELNAPFKLMWSCYESGEAMCESCESCKRYLRAVA